jgi:hypothetical protein
MSSISTARDLRRPANSQTILQDRLMLYRFPPDKTVGCRASAA